MMIGEAIRKARTRKRWTQPQLASRVGTHQRNIGHWETGHEGRAPDWSALHAMQDVFEDAEFTLSVASWATGGRIGNVAGALNGSRHGAAMAVGVELAELQADMARAQAMLLADPLMVDAETLTSVAMNLLDVHVAVNQMLVELARDYGLSLKQMAAQHERRLKLKGYVQKQSHLRQQVA